MKAKPNKFTDSYTLSVKVTYMCSVNHTLSAQDHCSMKQFPRQFKAVVGSLLAIIRSPVLGDTPSQVTCTCIVWMHPTLNCLNYILNSN